MARCGGVRLIANPPGPVAQMWLSGSAGQHCVPAFPPGCFPFANLGDTLLTVSGISL